MSAFYFVKFHQNCKKSRNDNRKKKGVDKGHCT